MRFAAVLLTGGRSSRMGRDKAELEFNSQPLWCFQLAKLRALAPEEMFIAGPQFAPDAITVADRTNGAGPLGGVAAALAKCSAPLLLVLAIDLPLMTVAFLRVLLDGCGAAQGAVPKNASRFEPLAGVYPKRGLALADAALQRHDFSMQNFVCAAIENELLVTRDVSIDEARLFTNVNTPADFAAL